MPGFTDPVGMDAWMGDWIGRPARAAALELLEPAIARVPSCFIGYFKTAALFREQGYPVTIVELFPRPGDIHWNEADQVLRDAELVFMTGLTVFNETLEAVIRRTPSARMRDLMGPTVPASPALFSYGIDVLGITSIDDVELMSGYALRGGGSIANTPAGALRSLNMAKDLNSLRKRIAALSR